MIFLFVNQVRLVEEIKNRAKSILGSTKNYKEAMQLYSKAIEVSPEDALLYGNRSMCHLSMNNTNAALDDANKSLALDPSYAKGYYRKAMAYMELKDYANAYAALEENLKLVPTDKGVQSMLAKVTALRDSEVGVDKNKGTSVPKARSTVGVSSTNNATTTSSIPPTPPVPTVPKSKPPATTSTSATTITETEVADIPPTAMKGYKITSDGKKTSYFTNELDEHTKQLIGDIRPKKIDPTPGSSGSVGNNNGGTEKEGSSAWNSAGTFEEKNVSPWAREYLETELGV